MMPGGHGTLAGSIAAMTLLLVSCEPTATTPVSRSTSNPVVVYASYEDEGYLPDLFSVFTEATGIRIVVKHTKSAVDEVIANHGSPSADVLLTREVVGVWRAADEGAPSTTAISRRSSRVAVATRLNPEAQMKPVFMPSAPG